LIISTPPGQLPCKRIFFLKWEPDVNEDVLRQSIVDFISNVIQNAKSYNFTSIAFPAIGCGEHGCSVDIVVKTMVREITNQLTMRKLPLTVKFVVPPKQQNIYDEFCKVVLASQQGIVKILLLSITFFFCQLLSICCKDWRKFKDEFTKSYNAY
jgi:hypothetical protein